MSSERRLSDIRQIVSGLYTLGATIGTGHFAVVKLARHVFTQKEVAVKVIDKIKLDEISKAHLFQEVMCMKSVQHPNVVRLYEVIDTPNKLYLILEFADGGDMYDYIMKHGNGLNETLARKYFRQICCALKYCHEMHICHRDLKPENLVFFEKQGVVKLTDFGFSNQFSPGIKLLTSCGSLAYSAPEILLGDPYDAPAIDIWSLGVILFMLVTGRAPFQEANDSETVMMILDCSYKLPSNVSNECQNLIHHMIVREPEQRATLDEIMCDTWYRQDDTDDDIDDQHYIDSLPLISYKTISKDDHELILRQMIDGNIAEREAILKALIEDQYNHITATYYLLAEKILHDQIEDKNRNVKRQRRLLQPASDPFTEQIGVFISSSSNFNFTDVSLPITRRNSTDGDADDEEENFEDFHVKENLPPIITTPRHSIDSSNEQILPALVEDDEERPALQQRTTNINTQATPAQAMKIILEEDESPDSPPIDKTVSAIQQLRNVTKLNKIVENGDNDDKSSIPNTTIHSENSSSTNGLLRLKDLRSVVETKRRNFSRSRSSSDSEDNGSNHDMNRIINRKHTRSPSSLKESESLTSTNNHRGRSFSNIENILIEIPLHIQQQMVSNNSNDYIKRRSFSRASSITSNHRLLINGLNDDINADQSLFNDRTRSLSVDHRLANYSQISIASRTSIRYSTPRESTVFTKTDAPTVVRLIQQAHHHDPTDAIKVLIEHERLQQVSSTREQNPPSIIVEEDVLPLTISNLKSPINKDVVTKSNGHISSSQQSVLSTLKHSLIKHQEQRNPTNTDEKQKHTGNRHRACCIIL